MMLISKIEMSVINKMADVFVGNFINRRTLVSRQVNSISHTRCSSRIHGALTDRSKNSITYAYRRIVRIVRIRFFMKTRYAHAFLYLFHFF